MMNKKQEFNYTVSNHVINTLKSELDLARISCTDLAKISGCHASIIKRVLKDKIRLSLDNIQKLGTILCIKDLLTSWCQDYVDQIDPNMIVTLTPINKREANNCNNLAYYISSWSKTVVIKQSIMARKLGCSRQYVNSLFRKNAAISFNAIISISSKLNMDMKSIITAWLQDKLNEVLTEYYKVTIMKEKSADECHFAT